MLFWLVFLGPLLAIPIIDRKAPIPLPLAPDPLPQFLLPSLTYYLRKEEATLIRASLHCRSTLFSLSGSSIHHPYSLTKQPDSPQQEKLHPVGKESRRPFGKDSRKRTAALT